MLRPPRHGAALQPVQGDRRQPSQHRGDQQAGEHHIDREDLVRPPDEKTDSGIRTQQLRADDHNHGESHSQLQPGEDRGQRAGPGDRREHIDGPRPVGTGDIEIRPVHAQNTGHGIEQDQEKDTERHDAYLRRFADPQVEDDQRVDGNLGNRVDRRDNGHQQRADGPAQSHGQAQRYRRNGAEQESGDDALDAHADVVGEFSGAGQGHQGATDGTGRRDEAYVQEAGPAQPLPQQQQPQRRDQGQPAIRDARFHDRFARSTSSRSSPHNRALSAP